MALLQIHSLRTSICVCKYLNMLSATNSDFRHFLWPGPMTLTFLSPSPAPRLHGHLNSCSSPDLIYIICGNGYFSQAVGDTSFLSSVSWTTTICRLSKKTKTKICLGIFLNWCFLNWTGPGAWPRLTQCLKISELANVGLHHVIKLEPRVPSL